MYCRTHDAFDTRQLFCGPCELCVHPCKRQPGEHMAEQTPEPTPLVLLSPGGVWHLVPDEAAAWCCMVMGSCTRWQLHGDGQLHTVSAHLQTLALTGHWNSGYTARKELRGWVKVASNDSRIPALKVRPPCSLRAPTHLLSTQSLPYS